jgi:hypothetical protein
MKMEANIILILIQTWLKIIRVIVYFVDYPNILFRLLGFFTRLCKEQSFLISVVLSLSFATWWLRNSRQKHTNGVWTSLVPLIFSILYKCNRVLLEREEWRFLRLLFLDNPNGWVPRFRIRILLGERSRVQVPQQAQLMKSFNNKRILINYIRHLDPYSKYRIINPMNPCWLPVHLLHYYSLHCGIS